MHIRCLRILDIVKNHYPAATGSNTFVFASPRKVEPETNCYLDFLTVKKYWHISAWAKFKNNEPILRRILKTYEILTIPKKIWRT